MIRFLIYLAGIGGVLAGMLVAITVGGIIAISGFTYGVGCDLYEELMNIQDLDVKIENFYLILLVILVVIIVLSELGPVSRVVGKTFAISQVGLIVTGLAVAFLGEKFFIPFLIAVPIVGLIIGIRTTEDFFDFLLEHPILSILSAIPASFFIFDYILIMKDLFVQNESIITQAKESLLITSIIFVIFIAFEIVNIVRNRV